MKRLVKVAKELNVGLSTIVEHLHASGFEIDSKPTAKVTEEMYDVLVKEFNKSIAIKEQADKLVIGTRLNTKSETDTPAKKAPFSLNLKKKAPVAKPSPPPPPVAKKEPVVKEAPEVAKKAEETPPPPVEKKEEVKAPAVKEVIEPEVKIEKEVPAPKKEVIAPDEVKKTEKDEAPKTGLKVLGKINLDDLKKKTGKNKKASQKTSPEAPKTKAEKVPPPPPPVKKEEKSEKAVVAEKAKEQTAPPKAAEDKSNTEATVEKDGMLRAKTPELRGLKIMGKIDTAKFKKQAKPDNKKTGSGTNKKNGGGDSTKRSRRPRKTVTTVRANKRGNQGQGNQGGRGGRRPNKKDEVREISQKEIDEKIKATMARLSGGGKKKRQKMRRDNRERIREKEELLEIERTTDKLQLTEFVSVSELASLMDVDISDIITTCMNLGVIVSINQRLDAEIIELVASEFNHEVEFISVKEQDDTEEEEEDDPADLIPRAPIVTVMGHVDHGKTSLLDYIRKQTVVDGEAGGITQHIGAYEVTLSDGRQITFLDTPGHEAFTAMRARGAKVTDVAIIIIAADDNIMPQTKEAISHAQAAGVPMVFAINKIDKAGAQPERIKQELASMNLLIEEWGGEYQSADISAKTGENIMELLEKVLLQAEMLELTANPKRKAFGVVLEASLDKGRGYVSKMLVENGTLNIGDPIVSGGHSGKVKAMYDEFGQRITYAGPSTPVLVLGLSGAPQAGERFKETDTEQEARQLATKRAQIVREQTTRATKRISLDEIGRRLALGSFKELNLIVKGDVDGSIEALSDSLIKLSLETVQVNVIHKAVGQVIESDVLLASASDAIIIGFQVRPSAGARKLAEVEGVQIKTYSIIYEAIEEITSAIQGMLEPIKEEKITAQVEVRNTFKVSKVGTIAGCYVQEGKITRNSLVRLIRDGIVIYPTKEGAKGEINSLKRIKDDAKEVKAGLECGLSIKNYNDIKVGDVIEAYEIVEIDRVK